jgi:hypothetical protein
MRLLLLLCIALVARPQSVEKPAATPYEDADAYQVYSAVLPGEWTIKTSHAQRLVILALTRGGKNCVQPDPESRELLQDALLDFNKKNQSQWTLQTKFVVDRPYALITDDEKKSALAGGWESYYKQYPDSAGYLWFSAVGFNKDKTIAIFQVNHDCGLLCGGGGTYVMQKKDGKWLPVKWKGTSCAWNS